ncbi:MAG TPA: hypothetical protein PKE06_24325 [Flavilitoribacter sp.]|nr:hypothetical protein [Lewinella sp.]HMQ63832.1 hypothetical protein [Flavilitoribacter sp.]HMQ88181.1 hypothetical protein [Flavilitoribacter sp.]
MENVAKSQFALFEKQVIDNRQLLSIKGGDGEGTPPPDPGVGGVIIEVIDI